MDSINNNQLIQIYTVGILKDEINELRRSYLDMKEEMKQISNSIYIFENKINLIHSYMNNDFENKMNHLYL